ncbi:hypothetical protein CCACVL1_24403 [Corchorus capsularis]|uniref:Transmembrane protein n=1 Tax=Corchorus capsularis TaxID=210143 RepID=A0A1R3GPV3_COCAP|nr:hypothetical protein CCACVL1_24403 [Corchorus capsularis]
MAKISSHLVVCIMLSAIVLLSFASKSNSMPQSIHQTSIEQYPNLQDEAAAVSQAIMYGGNNMRLISPFQEEEEKKERKLKEKKKKIKIKKDKEDDKEDDQEDDKQDDNNDSDSSSAARVKQCTRNMGLAVLCIALFVFVF